MKESLASFKKILLDTKKRASFFQKRLLDKLYWSASFQKRSREMGVGSFISKNVSVI